MVILWALHAVLIFYLILAAFFLLLFILQVIGAVCISLNGGSGIGFFFFSWIYILFSTKANDWKGFDKTTAAILGIFTSGLLLPVYILFSLGKSKNKSTSRYQDDD
jgi:hypothetical protein